MKKSLFEFITLAALLAVPLTSSATVFFADTFGNGSTVNSSTPATPTATSADYKILTAKPYNPSPSIASGHLIFGITNSTSGVLEVQTLFTTNPVALVATNDYIQLTFTFTDIQGLLTQAGNVGLGMYNANQVPPVTGGLTNTLVSTSTDHTTGGAQLWQGYVAFIADAGYSTSSFYYRMAQSGAGNNNQDLVTRGSGTMSYTTPSAASFSTLASPSGGIALTAGSQYTETLSFTLLPSGAVAMTNNLYSGTDTTATPLSTMAATNGATLTNTVFDGLAFGWYAKANTVANTMDVNAINISGSTTVVTTPPTITAEPASVVVATNGSCAMSVSATGVGVTYQWYRNRTKLTDGGNISGSTSAMLVVSPAGTADALSGTNGYYVTVTGAGNYSTNSTTNSLTLDQAANLTWSGAGSDWNLATTGNWQTNGVNGALFNYGDNVTFDDTAVDGINGVNLVGNYLSAGSVTINNNSEDYTFSGSGSIAGSGALIYEGSGHLTMNCVNTYSGGTIISNSSAYFNLLQYGALGTGPVTLALPGTMEITPAGGASTGIKGDVIINSDFTIQFDGSGSYATVLFGNLSGIAGKTLTLNPKNAGSTTNRIRAYGTNTVCNANLAINSSGNSQPNYYGTCLAMYNSSGSQTYNGVISGSCGLVQRDAGTTILNGPNTYTGGTTPTTGVIALGTNTDSSFASGPIGTGALFLSPEVPNATGSGQVMAWGGARTVANPLQYPSATNNLTLIIGGANALTFSGPITLNGLDGGTVTYSNRFFQVTNTALTTFSGVVSDGGLVFGVTKTGSGILALNNTETYTGQTIVSNGTLLVNGSLNAASAVTLVSTNATLAGTGTVNGPVTVSSLGILAAGTPTTIGTLTINNNVTNNGSLFFKVNKSLTQSNDIVSVSVGSTLTNSGTGTLTITNIGATALAVGDRFKLFSKALTGGGALTVTGGGSAVIWSNSLATDGSITVAGITYSKPVVTSMTISSGTNLVFTGTNATVNGNYYVLYQTNLTKPLTNWIPVYTNIFAGSSFSITVTNPVLMKNTNQFFIFKMY
jgi:autotransporter-associated beta strand protein